MGVQRGPGRQWILLAAWMGFNGMALAAPCTGPPDLTAKLHAHPTTENAILLGNWFANNKQFQCAFETFRAAIKTNPGSAQLYYLEGVALVAMNRPAEALPALQQSIRLESDVVKPHLMLAHLYDQAAQRDKAEEQWKQALAIDPHSVPALEGLSADLLARQDYVDVIGLLRNAPRTERLAISLSKALGILNYLEDAKKVLAEALELSPGSVPLASAMTVVLVKQRRYQEAIDLLQRTVEKNPGNQEAEVELFRVLVLTNHINLARPMGPKLLAQRPHDAEVLYLNGIVERSVGDYAQAKAHLEAAVAIDPGFPNSRLNLGMVLVFLQEWKEAAEHLEKAIALGATEPEVHFELAKALRGLGENDRALEEMKQYQQLKRADEANLEAATAAAQGDTELAAGKLKEAIAHYREAAEGMPDSANYKFKLAIALHRAGDTAGERDQLEAAIKLKPDLAEAQEQLGYLLSRSGDADAATEHFRMAVHAAPAWVQAWINLAAELAEGGHFAEARDAVATALRLDPANPQAHELSDQLARDPGVQQAQP
jgi:tetratricopeptide (TPR) repeat protein